MNQTAFARALLDPRSPVPKGWATRSGGDTTARLNVYRNNVLFTLLQALRDSFPVLLAVVGQAQFDDWALAFVRTQPPRHPVLAFYGEAFADALIDQLDPEHAHLADLARLEFARIRAFHASDDTPMEPAALAALLAEPERLAQLQLPLCASVTVLCAEGPVFDLWAGHQQGPVQTLSATPRQRQSVLVTRENWEAVVLRIDHASAAFFLGLQAQHTLAEALDAALECDRQFDLSAALALLLRQGCIRAPVSTPIPV